MKITNPLRKSDIVLRQLHHGGKFETMVSLRAKLVEEFKEQVPNTLDFNVGYFAGQSHSKISLVSNEDLEAMYAHRKKGDITLWCDSRVDTSQLSEGRPGKRRKEETPLKRQEKEDEVEETYEELMEIHHDSTYSTPQLRLWARMIVSHLHSDRETPPNIPAFSKNVNSGHKRSQQSAFSEAITGAAVAFAETLRKDTNLSTSQPVTSTHVGTTVSSLSPAKIVELHMKLFEQLQYLQQLLDSGILTHAEYSEQKDKILASLRNL